MRFSSSGTSPHTVPSQEEGGCLVIQPLPGVGDGLWHLRALKALARRCLSGKITLLAKRQSQIDKLIAHEEWVQEILWLDPKKHFGHMGGIALGRLLKEKAFSEAWILHHSPRYYIATSFAGIKRRYGYGFGWLKGMLTSPKVLDTKHRLLHPIMRFENFFKLHSIPLEPEDQFLNPQPEAIEKIKKVFVRHPRPWTVLGFGATNPKRVWPLERFAELAVALQQARPQTIFLCGAQQENEQGEKIRTRIQDAGYKACLVTNLGLDQTSALLSEADCFIGNDSGLLNLAGALRLKAVGLFGNLGVLPYNQDIFECVLEKERDRKVGNMAAIQVQDVMAHVL